MNKKTKFAILSVIALILVTLGLTYAYWLVTKTQTKENAITAGCLDISLSNEQNDIALTEQFPISDEEGKTLTPYTFTITNNCNTAVDYYLNLEALGDSTTAISASALSVMLNENNPVLLSDSYEDKPTITDAYTSYRLDVGTLDAKGSKDYVLRLWLDEAATNSEMNKTFSSKVSITVGQGVNNPLKEGTLAYAVASNYGGQEAVTNIATDWVDPEFGEETTDYTGDWDADYYAWGTDYKFDKNTGYYKLTGEVTIATLAECFDGIKKCGLYTFFSEQSGYDAKIRTIYKMITENTDDLYYIYQKKTSYNEYYKAPVKGESGLYMAADDSGISYYLRGDVTNNYVKFGKYAEDSLIRGYYAANGFGSVFKQYNSIDECTAATTHNKFCDYAYQKENDMYWRIVRINGDGTIRLIYDGVDIADNVTQHMSTIDLVAFNDAKDDIKYVGYTYEGEDGTQVDSTIKGAVDDWYETNLKTNYEKYIADSIFCNDRSIYSSSDTETVFNGLNRINEYSRPKLNCVQENDRYTKSTDKGNGYLKNPVGLITMDEAIMAGVSGIAVNRNTYLYSSESFRTMTPVVFSASVARAWSVNDNISRYGNEHDVSSANTASKVRPVINLKADVKFTGLGTIDSPYVITTN